MFGSRNQLVRVGMLAVLGACGIFALSRLSLELATGAKTPWWANALGLAVMGALWFWFRGDPEKREPVATHITAVVAAFALLPPIAYGMPSTLWWLALVPFAMMLMAGTIEGLIWTLVVVITIGVATWAGPWLQVEGAAGETPTEVTLARVIFTVLLAGIAWGFRREVESQAEGMRLVAGELKKSNAAKTRFLAQISHDLRNPLHGVIAMTDLAIQEDLPVSARAHLRTSQASAQVLLRLLNDLLDVTRTDGARLTLEKRAFDLHVLLRDVLVPFAYQAKQKGLYFSATADPDVAALRSGDSARVTQIVMNLVGNAVKFTETGGVWVRLAQKGRAVRIEVHDTGRGVPLQDRARIFEPFEQARRSDGGLGGVGLGLAISRELALLMAGDLRIEDGDGSGVCFVAVLDLEPLDLRAGPVDLLTAEDSGHPEDREDGPAMVVLVVDDDPTNRLILSSFLQNLGHEVLTAENGEEALRIWREQHLDAVLTDAQMPVMTGLELLRALRKEGADLPLVVCTASGCADVWREFEEAGATAALWKPFVSQDVSDLFREFRPQQRR